MHTTNYSPLLLAAVLLFPSAAHAQSTRPATMPAFAPPRDATHGNDAVSQQLGERFTSLAAGISFHPPSGGTPKRRLGIGTDIVQYANPQEKWVLKVSRLIFDVPARLLGPDDPNVPDIDKSPAKPAILEETIRQLRLQNPATHILRKDVINVGVHDVGLVVSRYTQGAQTWLRQQAFFRANDILYYVFDLTTPSGWTTTDKDSDEDPTEATAVEVFNAMLDSAQLLDQRPIIEDNNQRLYRTRALQVNLPKRLQQAVLPEQCFRVLRHGKDIGWSFVAQEIGQRQGKSGILVATLSHSDPEPKTTTDAASEMFCCLDLKTADEAWVTINVVENDGKRDYVTEIGQSAKRIKRTLDDKRGLEEEKDARQPRMRISEVYSLSVTQTSKPGSKQISRDLPPFYLPQAIGVMLPQALPINEPKT